MFLSSSIGEINLFLTYAHHFCSIAKQVFLHRSLSISGVQNNFNTSPTHIFGVQLARGRSMAHCASFVFFAIALASLSQAANWCGTSWTDASKCRTSCPRGMNDECPGNESCFADVSCTSTNPQQLWCGSSFADARKCRKSCPNAVDSDCPTGESCFADVTCSSSGTPPSNSQPPSSSDLLDVISSSQFNTMFSNRDKLYTYNGFISAATTFPGFLTTGTLEVRRREAAAFCQHRA